MLWHALCQLDATSGELLGQLHQLILLCHLVLVLLYVGDKLTEYVLQLVDCDLELIAWLLCDVGSELI